MDELTSLFAPNPAESILQTLEDFSSVITVPTGAILYPRPWAITDLPRNLQVASIAAGRGLAGLDHVKRAYTNADQPDRTLTALDAYSDAYQLAKKHMRTTRLGLVPDPSAREDHFGPFAAAVALQRLESGFRAAQLLYRLGLNIEGDAVSRQILEQIAWALSVSGLESLQQIDKIEPQAQITRLKKLVPDAGILNGRLSDIAHASLAEHRALFVVDEQDRAGVLLAWGRLSASARLLLNLADAWVIVCEFTQSQQVGTFRALRSRDLLEPDPEREFLVHAKAAVALIEAREITAEV